MIVGIVFIYLNTILVYNYIILTSIMYIGLVVIIIVLQLFGIHAMK